MDLLLKLEDHVRNLGLDRDDRLYADKQNDIRIVLDDLDLVRASVE